MYNSMSFDTCILLGNITIIKITFPHPPNFLMPFVIHLCLRPHPQADINLLLSQKVSLHFLDFYMNGII